MEQHPFRTAPAFPDLTGRAMRNAWTFAASHRHVGLARQE